MSVTAQSLRTRMTTREVTLTTPHATFTVTVPVAEGSGADEVVYRAAGELGRIYGCEPSSIIRLVQDVTADGETLEFF